MNANDKKERKAIHWAAYNGTLCCNLYIFVKKDYIYKKKNIFTKLIKKEKIYKSNTFQ